MAARTLKTRHQEEIRRKIQVSQIINRFQDALDGKVELTAVQVSCGKTLLDKSLASLTSTEMVAEIEHNGEIKHTVDFEASASSLLDKIRAS